jgi:hypothetical protein
VRPGRCRPALAQGPRLAEPRLRARRRVAGGQAGPGRAADRQPVLRTDHGSAGCRRCQPHAQPADRRAGVAHRHWAGAAGRPAAAATALLPGARSGVLVRCPGAAGADPAGHRRHPHPGHPDRRRSRHRPQRLEPAARPGEQSLWLGLARLPDLVFLHPVAFHPALRPNHFRPTPHLRPGRRPHGGCGLLDGPGHVRAAHRPGCRPLPGGPALPHPFQPHRPGQYLGWVVVRSHPGSLVGGLGDAPPRLFPAGSISPSPAGC